MHSSAVPNEIARDLNGTPHKALNVGANSCSLPTTWAPVAGRINPVAQ